MSNIRLVLAGVLFTQAACAVGSERVELNTHTPPPRRIEVWHAGTRTDLERVRVADSVITGCVPAACATDTTRMAIERSTIDSIRYTPGRNWLGVAALPVAIAGTLLLLRAAAGGD